jgi:Vam6/Vps39-like protein vacuolar protein sorting-associated protein 39
MRAYVQSSSKLLGPLLRNENFCNRKQTENLLKSKLLVPELIDFYKVRSLHRDALELISNSGLVDEPKAMAVDYMKLLNPDNDLGLILEFFKKIFDKQPRLGLTVFTENLNDTSHETRVAISQYLDSISSTVATSYLEHLVLSEVKDGSIG